MTRTFEELLVVFHDTELAAKSIMDGIEKYEEPVRGSILMQALAMLLARYDDPRMRDALARAHIISVLQMADVLVMEREEKAREGGQ